MLRFSDFFVHPSHPREVECFPKKCVIFMKYHQNWCFQPTKKSVKMEWLIWSFRVPEPTQNPSIWTYMIVWIRFNSCLEILDFLDICAPIPSRQVVNFPKIDDFHPCQKYVTFLKIINFSKIPNFLRVARG